MGRSVGWLSVSEEHQRISRAPQCMGYARQACEPRCCFITVQSCSLAGQTLCQAEREQCPCSVCCGHGLQLSRNKASGHLPAVPRPPVATSDLFNLPICMPAS